MASRLLALLAAVAMIAAALVYRNHRDTKAAVSKLRIVCSTEVAAACDAISGEAQTSVEQAGTTARRLESTDAPDVDAWLTAGPWPEIVDDARVRQGKARLFTSARTVASSRIAVAAFADRAAVLTATCGGPTTWKCVSAIVKAQQWPTAPAGLSVAINDPASSATGAAELSIVLQGQAPSGALTAQDLDDDNVQAVLSGLAHTRVGDTSIDRMIVAHGAEVNLALTTDAEATPVLAQSRQTKPVLIYPSPVAVIGVELGKTGRAGATADEVVQGSGVPALLAHGWSAETTAALPSAGVIDAARAAWLGVR